MNIAILFIIGIIPWALILLPIHEHYNWEANRNNKLVNFILHTMYFVLAIQLFAAITVIIKIIQIV